MRIHQLKLQFFLFQKVTDLDFSWVSPRPDEVPDLAKGSQAPGSHVTINFSKRSIVTTFHNFSKSLSLKGSLCPTAGGQEAQAGSGNVCMGRELLRGKRILGRNAFRIW